MPYILVRGNLVSYEKQEGHPWRVLVSGLQAADIEQLKKFHSGGFHDTSSFVYHQHPCVILNALEVLGFKIVASCSTGTNRQIDYNEFMWTMRREFEEPEPEPEPKPVVIPVCLETYARLEKEMKFA